MRTWNGSTSRRSNASARSCSKLPSSGAARLGSVIARYSRPAMARVWSDEGKLEAWFEVELAALDAWAEAGAIPADAAESVRANTRVPTPERVAEIEAVTDHDT